MDAKLIGKRIQMVRRSRGLTQEQLSQMVDISANYMSNIETGIKIPRLETLIEIINALQCDANAILSDVVDASVTQESGLLSQSLSELSLADQRRIKRVVEFLIDDAKQNP